MRNLQQFQALFVCWANSQKSGGQGRNAIVTSEMICNDDSTPFFTNDQYSYYPVVSLSGKHHRDMLRTLSY